MLRIMQVEEIAGLLLLLPNLVEQQQRRSTDFAPQARAWLNSLEEVFAASRLYQTGSIAMLRSGLIAAEQGQVPTGLQFRGRPTRSRVLNAAASEALQRAVNVASTLIAENQPRLAEAERVAHQIVTAAVSRGLTTGRAEGVSNTEYLRMLWRKLMTSPDLENGVVHLEGLVGPYDALILIDRALAPYLEGGTSPGVQSVPTPSMA